MKLLIPKVIDIIFKLTDSSSKKVKFLKIIYKGCMGWIDRNLNFYFQKKNV